MSGPPPFPGPPPYRRAPPPRRGSRLPYFVVGAFAGVVALGGLLLVGGLGALFVFGGSVIEEQVAADLADNPVLDEHVGDDRKFDIQWVQSGMHPDNDTFIFRVTGSKATGVMTAKCITVSADKEDVTEGTINVGGRTYDLFPPAR
jgi:hypothetical protein